VTQPRSVAPGYSGAMPLQLVPPAEPSPREKVLQRVKKMARPDGMCQCNRCGGRTMMTLTNGVIIKKGRKTGGTVIEKDVCAHCWKDGVIVPMVPALKPI